MADGGHPLKIWPKDTNNSELVSMMVKFSKGREWEQQEYFAVLFSNYQMHIIIEETRDK